MGKATTAIYFSGAPADVSIENECIPFFSKAGILMVDLLTGNCIYNLIGLSVSEQPKIKLYKEKEASQTKTIDGLVMYLRPESVSLAELLLDGVEIRDGFPIKIQKVRHALMSNVLQASFDEEEKKKPVSSSAASGPTLKKTSAQKAICSKTLEKMQR